MRCSGQTLKELSLLIKHDICGAGREDPGDAGDATRVDTTGRVTFGASGAGTSVGVDNTSEVSSRIQNFSSLYPLPPNNAQRNAVATDTNITSISRKHVTFADPLPVNMVSGTDPRFDSVAFGPLSIAEDLFSAPVIARTNDPRTTYPRSRPSLTRAPVMLPAAADAPHSSRDVTRGFCTNLLTPERTVFPATQTCKEAGRNVNIAEFVTPISPSATLCDTGRKRMRSEKICDEGYPQREMWNARGEEDVGFRGGVHHKKFRRATEANACVSRTEDSGKAASTSSPTHSRATPAFHAGSSPPLKSHVNPIFLELCRTARPDDFSGMSVSRIPAQKYSVCSPADAGRGGMRPPNDLNERSTQAKWPKLSGETFEEESGALYSEARDEGRVSQMTNSDVMNRKSSLKKFVASAEPWKYSRAACVIPVHPPPSYIVKPNSTAGHSPPTRTSTHEVRGATNRPSAEKPFDLRREQGRFVTSSGGTHTIERILREEERAEESSDGSGLDYKRFQYDNDNSPFVPGITHPIIHNQKPAPWSNINASVNYPLPPYVPYFVPNRPPPSYFSHVRSKMFTGDQRMANTNYFPAASVAPPSVHGGAMRSPTGTLVDPVQYRSHSRRNLIGENAEGRMNTLGEGELVEPTRSDVVQNQRSIPFPLASEATTWFNPQRPECAMAIDLTSPPVPYFVKPMNSEDVVIATNAGTNTCPSAATAPIVACEAPTFSSVRPPFGTVGGRSRSEKKSQRGNKKTRRQDKTEAEHKEKWGKFRGRVDIETNGRAVVPDTSRNLSPFTKVSAPESPLVTFQRPAPTPTPHISNHGMRTFSHMPNFETGDSHLAATVISPDVMLLDARQKRNSSVGSSNDRYIQSQKRLLEESSDDGGSQAKEPVPRTARILFNILNSPPLNVAGNANTSKHRGSRAEETAWDSKLSNSREFHHVPIRKLGTCQTENITTFAAGEPAYPFAGRLVGTVREEDLTQMQQCGENEKKATEEKRAEAESDDNEFRHRDEPRCERNEDADVSEFIRSVIGDQKSSSSDIVKCVRISVITPTPHLARPAAYSPEGVRPVQILKIKYSAPMPASDAIATGLSGGGRSDGAQETEDLSRGQANVETPLKGKHDVAEEKNVERKLDRERDEDLLVSSDTSNQNWDSVILDSNASSSVETLMPASPASAPLASKPENSNVLGGLPDIRPTTPRTGVAADRVAPFSSSDETLDYVEERDEHQKHPDEGTARSQTQCVTREEPAEESSNDCEIYEFRRESNESSRATRSVVIDENSEEEGNSGTEKEQVADGQRNVRLRKKKRKKSKDKKRKNKKDKKKKKKKKRKYSKEKEGCGNTEEGVPGTLTNVSELEDDGESNLVSSAEEGETVGENDDDDATLDAKSLEEQEGSNAVISLNEKKVLVLKTVFVKGKQNVLNEGKCGRIKEENPVASTSAEEPQERAGRSSNSIKMKQEEESNDDEEEVVTCEDSVAASTSSSTGAIRRSARRRRMKSAADLEADVWRLEIGSGHRRGLSALTMNKLWIILNMILSVEISDIIKYPCDSVKGRDYYNIVKRPIFLETIVRKLESRVYKSVEHFVYDFRRTFSNARLFFEDDAENLNLIVVLEVTLDTLLEQHFSGFDFSHILRDSKGSSM